MADDIIAAFMQRLLELNPQTPADRLLQVEVRLRQEWGGARVYIGKATALGKAQRLGAELAAGVPLREAIDAAGCSRAGAYRLLSRRWKVR
jgi:hypothetical protein